LRRCRSVSVDPAAKASFDAFGSVHVVCNNAGVGGGRGIDSISLDNRRWVLDVNLMGVLYGIRTFLPHIRARFAAILAAVERRLDEDCMSSTQLILLIFVHC